MSERYIDPRKENYEKKLGARVFLSPDEFSMGDLRKIYGFFKSLDIKFMPGHKNPNKEELIAMLVNKGIKAVAGPENTIIVDSEILGNGGKIASTVYGFVGACLRFEKIISRKK